jgi:hypothetical protein
MARHTLMVWLAEIVEFVRRVRFAHQPLPLSQWLPPESEPPHTPLAVRSASGERVGSAPMNAVRSA